MAWRTLSRFVHRTSAIAFAENRLRVVAYTRAHPEAASLSLRPLVICGLPRTGTTLLQSCLALGEAVPGWVVSGMDAKLGAVEAERDARSAETARLASLVERLRADKRALTEMLLGEGAAAAAATPDGLRVEDVRERLAEAEAQARAQRAHAERHGGGMQARAVAAAGTRADDDEEDPQDAVQPWDSVSNAGASSAAHRSWLSTTAERTPCVAPPQSCRARPTRRGPSR